MSNSPDMDLVHKMVPELLALPPDNATDAEVILAFAKAIALLAFMVADRRGKNADGLMNDIIDLIEDCYRNQTVVVEEVITN